MMRSIGAVAAGIVFVVVVTSIVDIAMYAAAVFTRGAPLDGTDALIATIYRVVIGVLGGWLTARLAPARPMKHALILGVIGTVLGFLGLVVTWGKGLGPVWYPVAHVVLAIPEVWAGAKIHERL